MKLPKFAIQNYQFTVILFALALIYGLISYFNMPRTENPSVFIPGASVTVIYPGASPEDLEELIASPIEEAINELEDIKKINTTLQDGISVVSVEFSYETDAREKYDEVVSKINGIRDDLPGDILYLNVMQWNSTDVAIMQLALVSDSAPYQVFNTLASELKKELEKARGVKKVEIHAVPEQEIRVSLDFEKMAQVRVPLQQVEDAIQSYNAIIPGGSLKLSDRYFALKTSGSYNNLEEIENTIVASRGGKIIYLKNIADVQYGYADITYKARFSEKRAVFLSVQQKADFNIYDIMDEIKPRLKEFKEKILSGTRLYTVFDQSETVDDRINGFMNNLFQGILIVGILILLAIGVRPAMIVILAIPLSVIIGLGIVDLSGYGLQQISIAALVVALGLLVDNSIVMVENINRHVQQGAKPFEAAIKGASEIGWPIASATITTLLAFIPIIMMPDKAGDFIRSLPVTITATLGVSLLIALTLTPLAARFLIRKKEKSTTHEKFGNFKLDQLLEHVIQGPYRATLQYSMKRKGMVLLVALLALGGSVYLFTFVGVSFFPKAETPQFMVRVNMPEGTNLEATGKAARWVEGIMDTIPGVKHYATNIGKGNPRIYYNIFPKQFARHYAEIYVELHSFDADKFYPLVEHLREVFGQYTGARVSLKEFEQGVPQEAPVAIHILGEKVDVLRDISREVESWLLKSDGAVNVENQLDKVMTNLHVNINKDKASMLGVPLYQIDKTVRAAVNGIKVSNYRDGRGEEYDIVLRLPFQDRIKVEDLDKIHVSSVTGRMIPLRQLATIEFQKASSIITRYNLERSATILADLDKEANLDGVLGPIIGKLESYPFPPGYSYRIGGELEARKESFGGMKRAIVIAMIAIFAVLVLQFNSFVQPLIIFSAVPLAVIGSVLALYITGNTFSFTAFIGLISLVGIVVNNSIILVDYANMLRSNGMKLGNAIQKAGEVRFTPIILTALTTIGGLLPLTLQGGTLWAPMGWTIIGGLLVSTFLTLVVVPVLYSILEKRGDLVQQVKETTGKG